MLYETEGVTWDISMAIPQSSSSPAAAFLEEEQAAWVEAVREEANAAPSKGLLSGLQLLVVEDDTLIALDIAERLRDAGAEQVATAATEEEAHQILEHSHFNAALLDANLYGNPLDAIAAALTRRNIPFVFVTGYGREGLPDSFKQAPLLAKPFSTHQLLDVVREIAQKPDNVLQLKS